MNRRNRPEIEFTSRMTRQESFAALFYLPVHIFLLPYILSNMMSAGSIKEADANVMIYAIGIVYLLIFEMKFLRREFDPLCDNILGCIWQIFICYCTMIALNMIVSGILAGAEYLFSGEVTLENQNNEAIIEMAGSESGKTNAIAMYLAPIVEELLFRGGLFCNIRKKNRVLAYVVSMLCFSLYHVWGYALSDPMYWIYIIQYIPASYVLCKCYEKTNTIWASIFLHMSINTISLQALSLLEELM